MPTELEHSGKIIYVVALGPVEAPVAIDVYGKTKSSAPLWSRLCFDPGSGSGAQPLNTRPQIVSRVYGRDTEFDEAYQEEFLIKTAEAIASAIENRCRENIYSDDATKTQDDASSVRMSRRASYYLRKGIEEHLDAIDMAVNWDALCREPLTRQVKAAIEYANERSELDFSREQARLLGPGTDSSPWISGYSDDLVSVDFLADVKAEISRAVSLYGIEPESGESVWRARYTLTSRQEYADLWGSFLASAKDQVSISRDQDEKDSKHRREDAVIAKVRDKIVSKKPQFRVEIWQSETRSSNAALQQTIRHQPFGLDDIISGYKFDHGVVFLHGIGQHKERETLTKFGEPLLRFWSDLMGAATNLAKQEKIVPRGTQTYAEFEHVTRYSTLRNHADNHGFLNTVRTFNNDESLTPGRGFVCGGLRVKDTVTDTGGDDLPACSSVRLSSIYHDCSLRESNILVAEAHWTDKVISYSFDELWSWLRRAFSLAIVSQTNLNLRLIKREFQNVAERKSVFACFMTFVFSLVPIARHVVTVIGLFPVLTLIYTLLYLMLILRIIPIGPLQSLINKVVSVLAGTVGQSQVLIASPIRRNAIVADVGRQIDKILTYCESATVIAHSQGAEVARIVAGTRFWDRVDRWVTFGAGVTPLNHLREDYNATTAGSFSANQSSKLLKSRPALMIQAWYFVGAAMLGLFFVNEFLDIFEGFSTRDAVGAFAMYTALGAALALYAYKKLPGLSPDVVYGARELGKTRNFFASHDPVPDGPIVKPDDVAMLHDRGHFYTENEIVNYRSVLRDHTTYFKNYEEFVAPVGSDIASFSGFLPGYRRHTHSSVKPPAHEEVNHRRNLLWWYHSITLHVYLIIGVLMAYWGYSLGYLARWWETITDTVATSTGFWQTAWRLLGDPAQQIMLDSWPLFVAIFGFRIVRKVVFDKLLLNNRKKLVATLAKVYVLEK